MFKYILAFGFVGLLIELTLHSPPIAVVKIWPIVGIPAAIISHLNLKNKKRIKNGFN